MTTIAHNLSAAPDLNIEDIGELLVSVNEVTARLLATHETLREQVASLQSELAAANEQLRRSRALAALGEMAAGIAHEIRNPLASILLDVETLKIERMDPAPAENTCDRISLAVHRLDGIVRDVLAFARDCSLRAEPISVSSLFSAAIETCNTLIERHCIEVLIEVDQESQPQCHADFNLLVRALSNLIRNSIEAMVESDPGSQRRITLSGASTRVRIAQGQREPRVILAVEDSGPGVPSHVLERMFNPFFTTREAGTGLGLAIVHRIVDAHGGEVDVKSLTGSGARVELRLPLIPISMSSIEPTHTLIETSNTTSPARMAG